MLITVNNRSEKYQALLELIPIGEENGISMRALSHYLGTTPRSTRKLVEGARLEGNIIASGDAGYFIPETVEELRHYVAKARARSRTNFAAIREAEKLLSEVMCE